MKNYLYINLAYLRRIFFFIALLLTPLVNAIESKTEKVSVAQNVWPMMLGLGAILLLIFFLAFFIRKLTGINLTSKNIKVIETQSLGAKEKLVIVEVQGEQHVLGVTPNNINQLFELKNKVELPANNLSFDSMMKQFMHPHKLLKEKNNQPPATQSDMD